MSRVVSCPAPDPHDSQTWQAAFSRMLPAIRTHANIAFRHLRRDRREEAVQETIAQAVVAYARLAEQGRTHVAHAGSLARYGAARVRAGRRVGRSLNSRDVLSPYAQRQRGHRVRPLHRYDPREAQWTELVVEDRSAGPADVAAARVDFREWLATLSPRDRRLAERLAAGEQTGAVAKLFRVSAARVSQLRRELHAAWQQFHGERPADGRRLVTV